MKHNSDAPGQLALFAIAPTVETRTAIYDPYWDEVDIAPQHEEPKQRWNPADFGEVPHNVENDGQLSIFYDDSAEPPDPDDYSSRDDYEQAWAQWQILVGAQVASSTIESTVETRILGQATLTTKKVAPQHDTHWIERYWVERSGNKYWYYRYCWMVGRKKNRIYLGSVTSVTARRKKADVEVWIGDGQSPSEIEKLIRQQRGGRNE